MLDPIRTSVAVPPLTTAACNCANVVISSVVGTGLKDGVVVGSGDVGCADGTREGGAGVVGETDMSRLVEGAVDGTDIGTAVCNAACVGGSEVAGVNVIDGAAVGSADVCEPPPHAQHMAVALKLASS